MKRTRIDHVKRNRFSIFLPFQTIIGIGIISVLFSGYEKSWSYDWSDIRKEIKDSILIANEHGITSGFVGVGARSTMYEVERRHWIMRNATVSELIKLTEYPGGTVKAIAYEGLVRRKDFDKKTEYAIKAIRDTTFFVHYHSGCIGSAMPLNKYITHYVLNISDKVPPFPPSMNPRLGLTELEKKRILEESNKYPFFEY